MSGRTRALPTALGAIAWIAAAAVALAIVPWEGCLAPDGADGEEGDAVQRHAQAQADAPESDADPGAGEDADADAAGEEQAAAGAPPRTSGTPVEREPVPDGPERASGEGSRLTLGWYGPPGLAPNDLEITITNERGRRFAPTRRHRHDGEGGHRPLGHRSREIDDVPVPIHLAEFDGLPPGTWTPRYRLRAFPEHLLLAGPEIPVQEGAHVTAPRPVNLSDRLQTLPLRVTGAGGLIVEDPIVHLRHAKAFPGPRSPDGGPIVPRGLAVDLLVTAPGHRPARVHGARHEVRVTLDPSIRVTLVPDPPLPPPSPDHPGLTWALQVQGPGVGYEHAPVFPAMRRLARGRADWLGWLYAEDRFQAPGGRGWVMDAAGPGRHSVLWIGACGAHGWHGVRSGFHVGDGHDGRELRLRCPEEVRGLREDAQGASERAATTSRD